jgi:hypothetical protein
MKLYAMVTAFRLNVREVFMIGANIKLCNA